MLLNGNANLDHGTEPLLITAEDVAKLLSVSVRSVWRLRSAGRIPQPLQIGGAVRWRWQQMQDWIADGCPPPSSRDNGARRN